MHPMPRSLALLLIALSAPLATRAQEAPAAGRGGPMPPDRLLAQFDRNGDGHIAKDEAPERMLGRWDQIDTNGDGAITVDELRARDERVGGGRTGGAGGAGAGPGRGAEELASHSWTGDFSVVIIGSGSPRYDAERAGPSALVQYRGRCVLVDMGNGTQARLAGLGIPSRSFDALMLTHHHLDHDEEFIPLFLHARVAGSRSEIIGPPGTRRLADFTTEFYAEDTAYRLRRMGRDAADLPAPSVRELQGGESFEVAGMKVSTARVNHSIHTVAYRFDAGDRSIVISGDLTYSDSLVALAHDADILVIDSGASLVRRGAAQAGRPGGRAGAGGGDREHAHGSADEVVDMAAKSGARRIILTHVAGGEIDEEGTRAAFAPRCKGEVLVAYDGLEVAVAPTASATAGAQ